MKRRPGAPPDSPWRQMQRAFRPTPTSAQPRISTAKAPCRVCGAMQWRPDGDARCVGCELRAYGVRRG